MVDERIGDLSIYKMMSDAIKLSILKLLAERENSVTELMDATGASQTLISHKLKDLRENGMVMSRRAGKHIIYSISDDSIVSLLQAGKTAGQEVRRICNCVECDLTLPEGQRAGR